MSSKPDNPLLEEPDQGSMEEPEPEASQEDEPKTALSSAIRAGTSAITEIAVAAVKRQKGVFLSWTVITAFSAIVVLILAGMLIFKGSPGYATALVVTYLVLNGLAIFIPVWKLGSEIMKSIAPSQPALPIKPTWVRLVPQIPIQAKEAIEEQLKSFRHEALSAIRGFGYEIEDKMVRANIFVPDTSEIPSGGICELHIPKGFSIGMEARDEADEGRAQSERELRFWPNQGLTGIVFVKQKAIRDLSSPSLNGGRQWSPDHNLTDEHKAVIHPDLRWIVSYPIKVRDGEEDLAIGVFNVDGIGFDLTKVQLDALIGKLLGKIGVMAGQFRDSGFNRLSVNLERL